MLLVPVPGSTATRLAVEAALGAVGGVLAANPADADLLLVAGAPGPELAAAADTAWSQMPGPRARTTIEKPAAAAEALHAAITRLTSRDQRHAAAARTVGPLDPDDAHAAGSGAPMPHGGAFAHQEIADPHAGGGHHGHGGDVGDMQMPGGLPMADRASDRDGLTLDVLHVPLGPILFDWPAGMVVDLVL